MFTRSNWKESLFSTARRAINSIENGVVEIDNVEPNFEGLSLLRSLLEMAASTSNIWYNIEKKKVETEIIPYQGDEPVYEPVTGQFTMKIGSNDKFRMLANLQRFNQELFATKPDQTTFIADEETGIIKDAYAFFADPKHLESFQRGEPKFTTQMTFIMALLLYHDRENSYDIRDVSGWPAVCIEKETFDFIYNKENLDLGMFKS